MTALAWATGPIGRVILLVVAVYAWTVYSRHDAARDARAECKAAQMAQTITEITRQREAAKRALKDAREQATATTGEMTALQQEHDQLQRDYKDALNSCSIPDDIIKRMRRIR